ncbi:hypothetical protein [Sphingomonas sp.]|uniref:hypothetical protein n=1 Tax=Sphingomonas sp. TaxID=28214 RepID=UPI001B01207D|nr:hypothetical protein [Sphingomonas sp.]MBO9713528.1 hypothetical protein [Sphingomonas sp.]
MWAWIKLPKAVALIAFCLPWMTVSCGSTPLVEASGWGLAFGRFKAVVPRLGPSASRAGEGAEINIWLIAALAAMVVGLVIACLPRARIAVAGVLITSLSALALIWTGTWRYGRDALIAQARHSGQSDTIDASVIRIDWHFGFWLTLAMLALAAVMAILVLQGRDAAVRKSLADAIAPPEPLADPPPAPE